MAHMSKLVMLHSPTTILCGSISHSIGAITYRFNMPLIRKILQIVRSGKINSMRKIN